MELAPARVQPSSTQAFGAAGRYHQLATVATHLRAWQIHRLVRRRRAGARVADGSTLRAQVSTRQNAGRAMIVWATAYLSLRPWVTIDHAAVLALVVTGQLVPDRAPSRTVISVDDVCGVGAFAVAAVTSIIGVGVMSALGYWLPRWEVGQRALALVGLTTFLGVRGVGRDRAACGSRTPPRAGRRRRRTDDTPPGRPRSRAGGGVERDRRRGRRV